MLPIRVVLKERLYAIKYVRKKNSFHKLSVMIVYCIQVLLIISFYFTENAIYVSGTNFEIQMIFQIILNTQIASYQIKWLV